MKLNISLMESELKKYSNNKCIRDIILFGSLIRGKSNPRDIDILILFNEEINKNLEYEIKNKLIKIFKNISITSKIDINDEFFLARDSIYFEGYSLFKKKYLSNEMGYTSFTLFKYQTRNLTNTQKVTFYNTLNGRNNKGLIEKYDCIRFSNNTLLVPLKNSEFFKEFFEKWTEYVIIPILIPSRLAKKKFIE
jgi:predicted nucleotidyltransferase